MDYSGPIYEWGVQEAGDEEYHVAAYEDRHQCVERICSIEGECGVEEGIQQLGYHCGAVVADPQASLAVSETLLAPLPPLMVEPYVDQLGNHVHSERSADDAWCAAEDRVEGSACPVVLAWGV